MATPGRVIKHIGDLTQAERDILRDIWHGNEPIFALPIDVRRQLADLFRRAGTKMPSSSAQVKFNEARAKYLLGNGPNPGPSVNDFAKDEDVKKHRKKS